MHRYRGHRASSFYGREEDIDELVEIRARERTFDGAYGRTGLGNLGYALAILKLFDTRFIPIGVLYAILALLMFGLSYFRARHSRHDFADECPCHNDPDPGLITVGQHGKRIFGRPFVTAGWIVVAVTAVVASVEITLMALMLVVL